MDNDSVSFPILILNIILNIIVNVSMLLSYYFHTYSLYRFLIINRTYTVKRNRVSLILWRYINFALLLLLLLLLKFISANTKDLWPRTKEPFAFLIISLRLQVKSSLMLYFELCL